MQETLLIAHAVVGGLFIVTVLMQDKGVGFGGAIGGTGGGAGFYATQRGAAKVIHYLSIILCVAFFATALAYVVVPGDSAPATSPSPATSAPAPTPTPAGLPDGLTVEPVEGTAVDIEGNESSVTPTVVPVEE